MIHSMRWFGHNDPVSLMDLRQAGCTGVVTALHQIPVGEVWTRAKIAERKAIIEKDNNIYTELKWIVVESLPVHESIKKGLETKDEIIDNYIISLKNLALEGIKTVCYNFMPVLDWSRTKLNYELPDGSKALRFVWEDFAVFDIYILKRPNAHQDYSIEIQEKAKVKFNDFTNEELAELQNTVLLGLPGSMEAFELEKFQGLLDEYRHIDANKLQENLLYFLEKIIPVAQELGMAMCIHPDDPPFPLLGLPRVVSTENQIDKILNTIPVRANGLTFCTGSLGVRKDNDLLQIFEKYADRVHFLHLRSTVREKMQNENLPGVFYEGSHIYGDTDMVKIINAVLKEEKSRVKAGLNPIPMRPDHGHQMLDDIHKSTYPGYSAIGRLKGLAELRGIELAVKNFQAKY